ncbi:MAG: NUDIX hydrolase [Nocardioides sp.]
MITLQDTRVGCYAIVREEGRVLLAHWNEGDRVGWTLPGGGLEPGEQPEDCVVREVLEETGYDVALDGLLGVHVYYLAEPERINKGNGDLRFVRLVYRAHVVGGELRHEQDGTTDEARWVPLDDVADLPRVSLVDIGLGML